MRHLDTDALAAFVAVIDHGGFTAAGQRIGKTQAAVSLMLARLEARLGCKLVDRSRRGVALTAQGERLIGYARRIQMLEDEALMALQCTQEATRLRIGMPDDYLETVGCPLMQGFGARYPHLQLEVICDFSSRLEPALAEGAIDLAIITRAEAQENGEYLRSEAQFWCAAPGAAPEANAVLPLSLFADVCRARPRILEALDRAGTPWRVVSASSHLPGVLHAVRTGAAITALPASVVPPGWRLLDNDPRLPALPTLDLALILPADARLNTRRLAHYIREQFSTPTGGVVAARQCPGTTQAAQPPGGTEGRTA
ncbi:LysR substrate-binding domain-containing protein [Pseudomonas typographi]|uniref:LysR substrate-binding domain-containing protein n=1 Tax=Pseudomonas typographi TaxID=2715964 RepID=UPI001684CDD5|nr:LysR substrate-binding domain-containing protein [Pseudomonas typographi]MBD1551386.1 LysR family transcriptional regulator [Pseudomonas typographi]MBD1586439.1 LysR family transcriptional regulator [Pseudomonas typographi]